MNNLHLSRRDFLHKSAALAGTALAGLSLPAANQKRTAADQVPLGKTGLRCSRLGIGTGSNSGEVQRALGREGFNRLLRYAFDQGITYIDTAESYKNHDWIRDAIKGLPREKLFIQTKMGGRPEKPMEVLDRFRKDLGVDYIDSCLLHCMTTTTWPEDQKRVMDAFLEAQEKQVIRTKGLSCHSLKALGRASREPWVNINLVRVNPQAKFIDGQSANWNEPGDDLRPVLAEIREMRRQGHGVIGMKIIGNGDFVKAEDREKSIRFAMSTPELDAVVIGFKSATEIDEAITRMNRALSELG